METRKTNVAGKDDLIAVLNLGSSVVVDAGDYDEFALQDVVQNVAPGATLTIRRAGSLSAGARLSLATAGAGRLVLDFC